MWRLRRSTSIETGLLQIQGEVLHEQQTRPTHPATQDCTLIATSWIGRFASVARPQHACIGDGNGHDSIISEITSSTKKKPASRMPYPLPDLARCFLRLSDLDKGAFERLGRYEMALWRQVRQTLSTLERLRWRASSARSWRAQRPWPRTTGLSPIAESEG
jgi:hypothetical protein